MIRAEEGSKFTPELTEIRHQIGGATEEIESGEAAVQLSPDDYEKLVEQLKERKESSESQ